MQTRRVDCSSLTIRVVGNKPSGQSNFAKDRVAAAHGRFIGIRQVAPVCTPPNTCFPEPTRVHNPNGISIGRAVFAGFTTVTDQQIDRPTDHANRAGHYIFALWFLLLLLLLLLLSSFYLFIA